MRARLILYIGLAAGIAGCGKEASAPPAAPLETAGAFIARANHDLSALAREVQVANFVQATDITPDTEFIDAKANDRYLALLGQYAAGAQQFAAQKLAPADARALALLKLNECSIFGSAAAGERYAQMLARGASEPWQDTMQMLTGTRRIDAAAITEYFQPLMVWLTEQNKNRLCGWE